ncbi:MAG: apolipoprotein N-acyltransferase [Pseudomonadota bacterium]
MPALVAHASGAILRRPLLSALGGGAVLGLAQAPLNVWPALLVAGLLLAHLHLAASGPRAAAWLGLTAGVGHFALVLAWILEPFFVDAPRHGWMAPFALGGMAFGLGLFWSAAFALAALWRPGAPRLLALAALWSGAEWLRGTILTGFPWALPAYGLLETPWLQAVAWIGPYGLTFLLFTAICLPAAGLRLGGVALAIAAAAALPSLSPEEPPAPDQLTVRLVQPNAAQHLKWQEDQIPIFWRRQLEATAAAGSPDVVIWPEVAVPFLHKEHPAAEAAMVEAARGVPVIYGTRRWPGDGRWRNTLAVTGTDAVYDKVHLVPFGEYMPFADFFARLSIFGLAAETGGGYGPGPALAPLSAAGLPPFLPLICYEAVFPEEVRAGRGNATWLVHITNDAWFGTWQGPYQHLAQARFRAVEQGLPVARSANTGVSAVIAPDGRILGQIALGEAGYLDVALPAAATPPPYVTLGERPFALMLVLAIAAASLLHRSGGNPASRTTSA